MSFDWSMFFAVVARLFALSLIVQLALESLYRWTGFTVVEEGFKRRTGGVGLRFPIALALSLWLCRELHYDVLAELWSAEEMWSGSLLTALAVTGGTAPFLALASQIEAWKQGAKAATAQAQAVRSQVDRVEIVKVAAADAATEKRNGA